MISPEAASLTLSLAQGAIKLAGRMDRLMAEKDAVTGEMILPVPALSMGPGGVQMVQELKAHLKSTAGQTPDPLGAEREQIRIVLEQDIPDPERVEKWYKQFFPAKAIRTTVDPDTKFYKALQEQLPSVNWEDASSRYVAFYIAAGKDDAEISYTWRTALIVVDVLAEFGAENTSLFFDNQKARPVIEAVLRRFSSPDLETFTAWSPLLRHVLGATLNGLLDAREAWQGKNVWMDAVLNALVSARDQAGDDYLLGLIRGNGYRLLVSEGLSEAALILGAENASQFEQIVADVLAEAAPLVKADEGHFRQFFQAHWGDLLRSALHSLEKHGPAILVDEKPLLRETLLAMVHELAQASNKEFVSHEILYHLADAALSAVANDPSLITADIGKPWLKELVTSVTLTVGEQGIRRTFSKGGLEDIINGSLQVFAEHPELIIKQSGLLQELVGSTLRKVSALSSLNAEMIASAAVEGALEAVADNPALLDTKYAELTADFAGKMATLVAAKKITGIQAADIAAATAQAITLNPILFLETENRVNDMVVDAVFSVAAGSDKKLLAGAVLVAVVEELMEILARYGQSLIGEGPVEALGPKLVETLGAGVARAEAEIGRGLDLPSLPVVLADLVIKVAKGELTNLDPEDQKFQQLFAELAEIASV